MLQGKDGISIPRRVFCSADITAAKKIKVSKGGLHLCFIEYNIKEPVKGFLNSFVGYFL